MLLTLKDYILCYSPAYALGVATGLLLAVALRTTPNKTTQWRLKHGKVSKSVH
jgi:hypothetical protein